MIPLIGYAPDMDPTTPGVLTDCSNLIPFEGGFRGAPTAVSIGASALAASCRGAASTLNLTGNRRLIAGTGTDLYELSGASWTSRSRAGNYALGTDDVWAFAQFGDSTLAVTPSAVVQRSTTGAFANVAGSPQAKHIVTAQGFAVALNTSVTSDTWYCSSYLDETNWTLSVANQCVTGRLVGGLGPINAARRFGENIVAYKDRSLFVGTYVGAPEAWRWAQISNDSGCVGQDAVCDTPIGHIFVGLDNIYLFDGTVPQPLATGTIREWLFNDMTGTYQFRTQCLWDRANQLVWIYYPSSGSGGVINRCAVYHIRKKQWGLAHSTIQSIVTTYNSPTLTYDGGSSLVTTFDSGPAVSFDSLYWISGASSSAVFNSSNVLCTLTGNTSTASFTTGDMGDDEGYTSCNNFRVRYTQKPTTSTATGYTKDDEGDAVVAGTSASLNDGRHNMRQRARWHRFAVNTTGNLEVVAVRPNLKPAGSR